MNLYYKNIAIRNSYPLNYRKWKITLFITISKYMYVYNLQLRWLMNFLETEHSIFQQRVSIKQS